MRHHIQTALIAAVVAAAVLLFMPHATSPTISSNIPQGQEKESVYDRVIRTQTIRCGYFVWSPAIIVDNNTKEMSGIMHDITMELGQSLGLKIEWAQEITLSTYLEDLNAGKYDLECSGGLPNARRGKIVEYSTDLFYAPVYSYVRADDMRFDNNYKKFDDASIRMVVAEGDYNEQTLPRMFPHASFHKLPIGTLNGSYVLELLGNKADAFFVDPMTFAGYDHGNPGKLRRVPGPPISVMAYSYSIPTGEYKLQQMLNTATKELLYNGTIDRILAKYETVPGAYLRVSTPYQIPSP